MDCRVLVIGLICLICTCVDKAYAASEAPIGIGDTISIEVYNEPDLAVESLVGATGRLNIPLLGQIQVADKTPTALSIELEKAYFDGYLVNPSVTVKVIIYRPFYIRGAVKNPGSYPYVINLTTDQAIAIGGGLKDRASKRDWLIYRGDNKTVIEAGKDTAVYPGDIIEVKESIF